MANVKYASSAFNCIYNDIYQLLTILDENVEFLSTVEQELDEMSGLAITNYSANIAEFSTAHTNLISLLETTQQYMNDFKQDGDEIFKPINENAIMSLDVNAAKNAVTSILDVVENSLKGSELESPDTTAWISQKHEELDDGNLEALLNPMDEFKQRNCEAKFRKNEQLYKEAMRDYIHGITFETELEDLSFELKMYETLNADILTPMHDIDLYNGYLTATVGSAGAASVISMENKLNDDLEELERQKERDRLHMLLDLMSLVPVVGEFTDAANAIIYLSEGDLINAGISALALFPVAGSAFVIGRHGDEAAMITKNAIKGLDDLPQVIKDADYLIDTFGKSPLGIINSAARGDYFGMVTGCFGIVSSGGSKFMDEVYDVLNIDAPSVSEWVFDGIQYLFS